MLKFNFQIHVLACCLFSIFATEVLAQTPREISPAEQFAKPLLIVQPTFPADTSPEFAKVEVEVSGVIGADGKLRGATVRAPAGHAAFEKEILEVTQMWRFVPAVDNDVCEAKDTPGKVVVTFEVTDAKRAIYVTVPDKFKAASSVEKTAASKPAGGVSMKLARQIQYPDAAFRSGRNEGYVMVLAQVAGDGAVKKGGILASTPDDLFNRPVLQGIHRATFTRTGAIEGDRAVCILIPFTFCVTNNQATLSMDSVCRP